MFGSGKAQQHREVTAAELHAMQAAQSVVIVDVREANEFAGEHIAGAINLPLSRFDPGAIPDAPGKTIVLQCAGGKRSGLALDHCRNAEAAIDIHLAGGLMAWKVAGLPTVRGNGM